MKKRSKNSVIFFLLGMLAACSGIAPADAVHHESVIYLVRHAEKESGSDPALTEAGKARAERLAAILADQPVIEIWSTDTKRTLGTAAPLAKDHNLEVQIYEAGHVYRMADRVRERPGVIVIVGHSNTIPELASAIAELPTDPDFNEADYESLYRVDYDEDGVPVRYLLSYDSLEESLKD